MSRGRNKVILIGNLGQDVTVRTTTAGKSVANISLATSHQWKDGNGEKKEATEWHRLVAFGRLAEICGKYLQKGSLIYVEGRLQTRKWQDKNGVDKYTTEIVMGDMEILSGRSRSEDSQGAQPEYPGQPYHQQDDPLPDDDIPF